MADYIAELQAVILNLHGCNAVHIETVPVVEEFQGKTIWQGEVEVFETTDCPKAKLIYGWGHVTGDNDQGRRYVAVLGVPPISSPQSAVKAAIMGEIKSVRDSIKKSGPS